MSRIAKAPISLPKGVQFSQESNVVTIKGSKSTLTLALHSLVSVECEEDVIKVAPTKETSEGWAQAGTARALLNNMVVGVSAGFEKKLVLNGVGYRAQAQGNKLNLTLGFSHPVVYELPEGVTAECPSQTEIVIKGANKQIIGQVAANIRSFRPPEPYKGKGIRYSDEYVRRKEAKKK